MRGEKEILRGKSMKVESILNEYMNMRGGEEHLRGVEHLRGGGHLG